MWTRKKVNFEPGAPVSYPSGVFVDDGQEYWQIRGDKKVKVFSERVLESWQVDPLFGNEIALSGHKEAGVLGFRNGTLIRNIADSKYYLISDNKRRQIVNPDVFKVFNLDSKTALEVSDAEVNLHPEGEVLS